VSRSTAGRAAARIAANCFREKKNVNRAQSGLRKEVSAWKRINGGGGPGQVHVLPNRLRPIRFLGGDGVRKRGAVRERKKPSKRPLKELRPTRKSRWIGANKGRGKEADEGKDVPGAVNHSLLATLDLKLEGIGEKKRRAQVCLANSKKMRAKKGRQKGQSSSASPKSPCKTGGKTLQSWYRADRGRGNGEAHNRNPAGPCRSKKPSKRMPIHVSERSRPWAKPPFRSPEYKVLIAGGKGPSRDRFGRAFVDELQVQSNVQVMAQSRWDGLGEFLNNELKSPSGPARKSC